MGSQFVDLNGDGHLDYLSATFDGSPHIAWGSATGFSQPERLTDAQGRRLVISYIWDYEKRKHDRVGRAMPDGKPVSQRCISALAFDWDGDGDYDLLLGSYEEGRLYRQMNAGTKTAPKFTGTNIPVMAGDAPFAVPHKMTAPQLVDWDGDGDLDLLAGSFGDSFGDKPGGGVYLAINNGRPGAPAFGPLRTLIEPSAKGGHDAVRPDAGLYPHAVDYDGDGDLDLVVGGYSMWTPKARELSAKEQARVAELQAQLQKVSAEMRALYDQINAEVTAEATGLERSDPKYRAIHKKVWAKYRPQQTEIRDRSSAIRTELNGLVPTRQRKSFVWLYERL